MAPQTLPFDVLLQILEISPLATAAKMTRTCHTLRHGGLQYLLDGEVSLTSGDSIISFVQFLYADAANRFQYLRTLELACGELPPHAVSALLGLAAHPLLALDSLTLQEAESILTSSWSSSDVVHDASKPPLFTALARLTTLRHLAVRGHCGHYACTLIGGIRSPLKSVSMDFDHLRGPDDLQRRNPILTLANHAGTLEEISGSCFAVHPEPGLFDAVFPSVRTLSATFLDSYFYFPPTLALVAAFPNLTRLSLATSITRYATLTGSDLSLRMERAVKHGLGQRRQQEMHAPGKTWANSKLDELDGSLADILALGLLPCHVSMLRLIGTLSETLEYEYVKTVLEDTRPAGLAITMAMTGASTFGDMMGPVLRDPSAQQLRALEVELIFSASKGDADIQSLLNDVATTLAFLPLHRVTLTLNYGLRILAPEEANRSPHESPCHVRRHVQGFDITATRALFRAAIPSLTTDVIVRFSTYCKPNSGRLLR